MSWLLEINGWVCQIYLWWLQHGRRLVQTLHRQLRFQGTGPEDAELLGSVEELVVFVKTGHTNKGK